MCRLRHPNLILFIGYCVEPRPAILFEFMQRGSLYKVSCPPMRQAPATSCSLVLKRASLLCSDEQHGLLPCCARADAAC